MYIREIHYLSSSISKIDKQQQQQEEKSHQAVFSRSMVVLNASPDSKAAIFPNTTEQVKLLAEKRWCLLDVEFIQTSSTHRCIRKIYALEQNGRTNIESDFYPCKRYKDISWKYQRSFNYCRRHIHQLNYDPRRYSPTCRSILPILNEFIVNCGIELVLYKGGQIEKDLCKTLDIPSLNIESIQGLEKSGSHNPRTEVNCYFSQIRKFINRNKSCS